MAEINGFIFYKSFYEAIKKVPKEYQAEVYNAIFEYAFTGLEVEGLSNVAQAMFILIKPNIDSFLKKHNASVENGKKGGRPPKNKNLKKTQQKPKENPNKTQEKPKQNLVKTYDKEEDKEKDKEEDIDKEKDKEKINKKEKKSPSADLEKIIRDNFSDNEVIDCVKEFIKMRKAIKKPLTQRGLELMIKKLYGFTTNIDEQIEILNNSIMNNWQGIYPLKKDIRNSNIKGSFDDFKDLWEEARKEDEQAGNSTDNNTFSW